MRRAKSTNWPTQNGLLTSILLLGMILGGGLDRRAIAGDKPAAKTELPADLDLVPRHAVGFVHVRAADLWRSELAKDLRYLVDKAGPEAWKEFEKRSPINPAHVDRLTLVWLTSRAINDWFPSVDPEAQSALVVVRTSKPYDRLPLIQALGAKEKVYRDNLYYFNEELWSGLLLVDERTFLVGSEESLIRYFDMSRRGSRTGPLQGPLEVAAGKHQSVLGLNPTLLAQDAAIGFAPPPVQSLFGAHAAVATLDLDQGIRFSARLDFLDENKAKDGEAAARQTIDLARQELARPIAELEKILHDPDKGPVTDLPKHFASLVGLGFLREVDSQLKEAPIKREGNSLKLRLEYKNHAGAPLLLASYGSAFAFAFSSGARFRDFNKERKSDSLEVHLKNLAKAMEKYREKHGVYPPPAIYDKEGRPVLSWRVALLPYLDEEALYKEFNLNEPWDSLHNKRLLQKMPKALQVADDYRYGSRRWKSTTQVFSGANTLFEGQKGVPQADAARKVILLARVANEAGVYWTKPADVAYSPDSPLPEIYGKYGDRIQVLLTDGTYRAVERSMNEKDIRALIERSDKPMKAKSPPQLGELESIWNDLSRNDDAGVKKAWQGIIALSKIPDRSVPFVQARVKAVPRPDPKQIAQYLADLDSNLFKKRARAVKKLEEFGDAAMSAIDKKRADKSNSLETIRLLESLSQKTKTVLSGEELRSLRAVEILEQAGTPEARAVLGDLSRGAEGVVLTEQARRALARLAQRTGESKIEKR